MKRADALAALEQLVEEKPTGAEDSYVEWRSKGHSVLRHSFGPTAPEVGTFISATDVRNEGYTTGSGTRETLKFWRGDAINRGKAVLRAAIFTLNTSASPDPLDEFSIDPELWEHVRGLVEDGDWGKIPSNVVIFVEDKVRHWTGDPRAKGDVTMTGQSLMGHALGETGELRLGAQASEWQGWRSLGTGLVQAIGNVDRHRIQRRDDARRYALGVLGLGSLLLTQMRQQHSDLIAAREPVPDDGTMEAQ